MNLSKDDAARALDEIGRADQRMARVSRYGHAAPFFILWGVIWLAANTVVDLAPAQGALAWAIGNGAGLVGTCLLAARQARARKAAIRRRGEDEKALGLRWGLTFATLVAFFMALFVIVGPLGAREVNALISLIWAFIYMAVGVWTGWRIFVTGVVTAAAILFGFLFVHEHYYLWMGVFAGGSLILGGLWLRKI